MKDHDPVLDLLAKAKLLARQYYELTGKPLGVTGEVAEYEAARLLGITLAPARQSGYDATETVAGKTRTLQIKGRCLPKAAHPGSGSDQSSRRKSGTLC